MIGFKTTLLKFDSQGEKTGWTYILIPNKIAEKIKPANKKSFRVKGRIDEFKIKSVALLPMGGGDFIMPVNATMRKAIKKNKGASVTVEMEEDKAPLKLSPGLLACLEDDPDSKSYFNKLAPSHQQYYSKWIKCKNRCNENKKDCYMCKCICERVKLFANDAIAEKRSLNQSSTSTL